MKQPPPPPPPPPEQFIVNTNIIKGFSPCEERLSNWLMHYGEFNGNVLEFVVLDKITIKDKFWVLHKVLPKKPFERYCVDLKEQLDKSLHDGIKDMLLNIPDKV